MADQDATLRFDRHRHDPAAQIMVPKLQDPEIYHISIDSKLLEFRIYPLLIQNYLEPIRFAHFKVHHTNLYFLKIFFVKS